MAAAPFDYNDLMQQQNFILNNLGAGSPEAVRYQQQRAAGKTHEQAMSNLSPGAQQSYQEHQYYNGANPQQLTYLQKLMAGGHAPPPMQSYMDYSKGGDVKEARPKMMWPPGMDPREPGYTGTPKPPPVKPPPVKPPPVKPPGDDGRPKPKPTPPPGPPPSQNGFPAVTQGVNPVITPSFRHLFSNADVAKYGIKQPQYIEHAFMSDNGLAATPGVVKKWWLPNQPIVWGKTKTKDGK